MKSREFVSDLEAAGWVVSWRSGESKKMPDALTRRYEWFPQDYVDFLALVNLCVHPQENAWFQSFQNFQEPSLFPFAWNEWEIQSLDAAEADRNDRWRAEIRKFWDIHLPVAMSVRSGYSFLAVVVQGENKGRVVYGREPEYEDVWDLCDDLRALFDLASKQIRCDAMNEFLNDFL